MLYQLISTEMSQLITRMLSTKDLINYFRKDFQFSGVFPLNRLPIKLQKKPAKLIKNLDANYLPGSHWLAIYLSKNGSAFYFDPFGNPPPDEIATFLDRNAKKGWLYNADKIQANNSIYCGFYRIVFLKSCPNIRKFYKAVKACHNNDNIILKYIKAARRQ